jgi:hypothetical protein
MKSFKQYFEEENGGESIDLTRVPINAIGLRHGIRSLPEQKPYGFWIDKSGNFIPTQNHNKTAEIIVNAAISWMKKQGIPTPHNLRDAFMILMYDNGWMRVVTTTGRIYSEVGIGRKSTPSQLKAVEDMKLMYLKQRDSVLVGEAVAPELLSQMQMIPDSTVGFSNTLANLPASPPYGFWVSKHGNFIPVKTMMGHSDVGGQIVRKMEEILGTKLIPEDDYSDEYFIIMDIMDALHYCRVVRDRGTYKFDVKIPLTRGQKRFKDALETAY